VPKVYVVQDNPYSPKNFITAKKFGELRTCILGHVGIASLQENTQLLEESLADITKEDWLIMTGHPAMMGMAGYIMGANTGYVRILVWDNQANSYYPYERKVEDD
jgi:hypothetical protein